MRFFAFAQLIFSFSILTSLGAEELSLDAKIENAEKKLTGFNVGAFALSMYYQGFSHSILDDIEKPASHHHVGLDIPTNEDMRKKAIKVRDASKAFELADKYYNAPETVTYEMVNMANIYLQGIGTEKNIPKALEILRTHIPGYFRFYGPSYFDFDTFRFAAPLVAYLYHHGIGVEKDFEKRDIVLDEFALELAWKNFYAGYLVPRDYELAIHALARRDDFWAAEELVKIYSGEYLPEHANKEKADYWRPIATERRTAFIKSEMAAFGDKISKDESDVERSRIPLFWMYGTKTFTVSRKYVFDAIEIVNPYYDKNKSLYYFNILEEEYKNNPQHMVNILKNLRIPEHWSRNSNKVIFHDRDMEDFLLEKQKYYEKLSKSKDVE